MVAGRACRGVVDAALRVVVVWLALGASAAAAAAEPVPDPRAWAPHPEEAGVAWVWVTAVGSVSFGASIVDVTGVDPDGWLRIEERYPGGTRTVLAAPVPAPDGPPAAGGGGADGASAEARPGGVRFEFIVDGHVAPWDDAGRAWLAGLVMTHPALDEALQELERDRTGASRGTVTTDEGAWVSVVHVAPGMRETFGRDHLAWTLFGLGGPHPLDPSRPRREPRPFDVATEVHAGLFVAHQLSAHGLVTVEELEAFLTALAALLQRVEGEATSEGQR